MDLTECLNGNKHLVRRVLSLALPVMIEFSMQMVVRYVDLMMVGGLGVEGVAICGYVSQIVFVLLFPINALAVGVTVFLAKSYGACSVKDQRRGRRQALMFAYGTGILATLVVLLSAPILPAVLAVDDNLVSAFRSYYLVSFSTMFFFTVNSFLGAAFRGEGAMKVSMYVNLVVNICNIVFNFLLIYPTSHWQIGSHNLTIWGANLGLMGAATGTACAIVVGGVLMLLIYRKRHKEVRWWHRPHLAVLKSFIKVGLPAAGGSFITGSGRLVFTSFVSTLGVTSMAAHTISYSLEGVFYIPAVGFGQALVTLTGVCLGAQDSERCRQICCTVCGLSAGSLAILGAALWALSDSLPYLITNDKETVLLSSAVLALVAYSEPLFAQRLAMESFFQGLGRTSLVFWADIFSMWLFRVLICGLAVRMPECGLITVWWCMIADNTFLAVGLSIIYLRGRWISLFKRNNPQLA